MKKFHNRNRVKCPNEKVVCPYASACPFQKFWFRWNFCPTRINSKNVHMLLEKRKKSLPGLIFHCFLHFSYLSVITIRDGVLPMLLRSVAGTKAGRYLCPMNPSVFCGRTAEFGDEGMAVNTAYLDIRYIFYTLSHGVFVFKLGHGLGGQNTGGWWLVLCSAWRPVAGWSCWGPRGTCCIQLVHQVPRRSDREHPH